MAVDSITQRLEAEYADMARSVLMSAIEKPWAQEGNSRNYWMDLPEEEVVRFAQGSRNYPDSRVAWFSKKRCALVIVGRSEDSLSDQVISCDLVLGGGGDGFHVMGHSEFKMYSRDKALGFIKSQISSYKQFVKEFHHSHAGWDG